MKQILICIAILMLFFGNIQNIDAQVKKMRKSKQKSAQLKPNSIREIKLTIVYTQQYCGGANPPKQMLEKLQAEKPLQNTVLYFFEKKNETESILYTEIKTDIDGKVSIELNNNRTYCVVLRKDCNCTIRYKTETESAETVIIKTSELSAKEYNTIHIAKGCGTLKYY